MWRIYVRHRNVSLPSREIGPDADSPTITTFCSFHPANAVDPRFPSPDYQLQKVPKEQLSNVLCYQQIDTMHFVRPLFALSALAATASAFRFTVWLGDKCTINGARPSDQELLVIPEKVDDAGCLVSSLYPLPVHTRANEETSSRNTS